MNHWILLYPFSSISYYLYTSISSRTLLNACWSFGCSYVSLGFWGTVAFPVSSGWFYCSHFQYSVELMKKKNLRCRWVTMYITWSIREFQEYRIFLYVGYYGSMTKLSSVYSVHGEIRWSETFTSPERTNYCSICWSTILRPSFFHFSFFGWKQTFASRHKSLVSFHF